jgi:hypothetical protein
MSASSARPPARSSRSRSALEVSKPRRLDLDVLGAGQWTDLLRRDEEIGPEAVVLDEEGHPVLEPSDQLDHGSPLAEAVGRVEYQAAGHGGLRREMRSPRGERVLEGLRERRHAAGSAPLAVRGKPFPYSCSTAALLG